MASSHLVLSFHFIAKLCLLLPRFCPSSSELSQLMVCTLLRSLEDKLWLQRTYSGTVYSDKDHCRTTAGRRMKTHVLTPWQGCIQKYISRRRRDTMITPWSWYVWSYKRKKQQEKHQHDFSCVTFLLVISINKCSIYFGQISLQVCQIFYAEFWWTFSITLALVFLHFLSIHKALSDFKISAATRASHHAQSTQPPQSALF